MAKTIVMPGQNVTQLLEKLLAEAAAVDRRRESSEPTAIKLGPGLIQIGKEIMAIRAGTLHFRTPNRVWLSCPVKRYVPATGDLVVGIVSAKLGEAYRVDLGGAQLATLSVLSYEGATRRNRLALSLGSLVYARVSVAHKDLEPELVCIDDMGKSDTLGELKDGMLIRTTCDYSRRLMLHNCPLLEVLGKYWAFEIAAGANGRIFVKTGSALETIIIINAIEQAKVMSDEESVEMVRTLVRRFNPTNK